MSNKDLIITICAVIPFVIFFGMLAIYHFKGRDTPKSKPPITPHRSK